MSSVYDVPCMYVRIVIIQDGMHVSWLVCMYGTYGAILRIRRTEEYQSVGKKQARKQQQLCVLVVLFQSVRTD